MQRFPPGSSKAVSYTHLMDQKSIGFNADIRDKRQENVGELLRNALPEDFIKFGMIPEFMGRVPISVSLDPLSRDDMVRILLEPKNSIVRQYQKLFELDGVDLKFTDDAVKAIAAVSYTHLDVYKRQVYDHICGTYQHSWGLYFYLFLLKK